MQNHSCASLLPIVAFVMGATTLTGCNRQPASPAKSPTTRAAAPQHEHHAPHKGCLVELGEEFAHLELLLDPQTGILTAYALDGEAENPVRLKQRSIELTITKLTVDGKEVSMVTADAPLIVTLKPEANVLTGETVGDTSQFTVQSTGLIRASRFTGTIRHVESRGQEFTQVKLQYPEGNEAEKH